MFAGIELRNWRQFDSVTVDFDPQLTVLTGANGSGKTTLLAILARHFDWPSQFISVPQRDRSGMIRYASGVRRRAEGSESSASASHEVGSLRYGSGAVAQLLVHEPSGTHTDLAIAGQQPVDGLSVPSHRSAGGYQQIQNLPVQFNPVQQILASFQNEVRQRYFGSTGRNPLYWMKEALIAAAIFGEGNSSVDPNIEAAEVWTGFQATLEELLPTSLGFKRLSVRSPELIVETASGNFALDAASGGVVAIIEVAWQIFLRARYAQSFTVCIDEPENHLHPALQRWLIPRLVRAFPKVQFIVATHSPFIVGSTPDANVYVLSASTSGYIQSQFLDMRSRAGTASDILRDVLGVPTTIPVWAEDRLVEIVDKYSQEPPTEETLASLRQELDAAGLGDFAPGAIADVIKGQE